MKIKHYLSSLCAAAVLAITPLSGQATPSITYDIGNAPSGSGIGASYLHSATTCGSDGYCKNGDTARIAGTLTYDLHADGTGTASGSLVTTETDTDFGSGSANWEVKITGMTDIVGGEFQNGSVNGLLFLDYELFANGSTTAFDSGTFYFADRNFGSSGANTAGNAELFLWGNNWKNASGSLDDKDIFTACPTSTDPQKTSCNIALGMDLYGTLDPTTTNIPEPGILALLAIGLIGFGASRRFKT